MKRQSRMQQPPPDSPSVERRMGTLPVGKIGLQYDGQGAHPTPHLPGGPVFLWTGAAVMLSFMTAGLIRSLMTGHGLPAVGFEYASELNEMVQERGYEAALPYIRSAARIDFDNEAAVTAMLESARQVGDEETTLAALLALTRLKPEDVQIRNEVVSALLNQGRVVEALAHGEFAARLNPNSSVTYCNIGAALLGMGQKREAAAAYRRALELDPNSKTARLALDYPLRGF